MSHVSVELSSKLLRSYVIGFVSAIVLTITAFLFVMNKWVEGSALVAVIIGLALIQLAVQLIFFLHLSDEPKPRWNAAAFAFMAIILVIVVGGSLWIMYSLNYNMMMTPEEMDTYMKQQSAKGF